MAEQQGIEQTPIDGGGPGVFADAADRSGAHRIPPMTDDGASTSPTSGGGVAKRLHPIFWVPSLYFAMGLPMITVSVVAAIMYKNLGVSNAKIALHTGLLYLPWTLKPLWAPVVEMYKTKKHFVIGMELFMAITLGCVALALPLPSFMPVTLAFFWVTGFASSTQDIAADGVYISTMSPAEQSKWVGIQGIFWNIGRVMASGLLVTLTGYLHISLGYDWVTSWMVVMGILAAVMGVSAVYHARTLPSGGPAADAPKNLGEAFSTFSDSLKTFFQKKDILLMVAFVALYRSGEGLLEKIGPLFMMDKAELGGLALSNMALGNINGTFGTIGFMAGALLGGAFAARLGLKRSLLILCVALNLPNVTYIYLSHARPDDLTLITVAITVEKLGYGFGSVGHMLYMMQQLAPGKYKTAHYAFATGLMAVSLMVPSALSGFLQEAVGYQTFFILVMVFTIPSFIATWFAPFHVGSEEAPAPS